MVTWIKQVAAGDTGTATEIGSDQWNILDKYHGNVDVSASLANPTQIATPTTYNSGILKFGNASNSNKVAFTSSAQTGNFNINIPILTADVDLPISTSGAVSLSAANIFTNIQTIQSNNDRILKLYRPANTANNIVGLEFQHQNSANAQTEYARITGKLITNTAAAEDGYLLFYCRKAGTTNNVATLDNIGQLSVFGTNSVKVGGVLKNSGVVTTTVSSVTEFDMLNYSVPANLLGTNGALRVIITGYFLQNQVTAVDYTLKVKFGGTTIYNDLFNRATQSATNLPFYLQLVIGNKNATNSQGMSGFLKVNDVSGATTGEGDISDDETHVNANIRGIDPAKDTTSAQTLQVTMTHSVNDANVQTSVQRQIIEFIPGA